MNTLTPRVLSLLFWAIPLTTVAQQLSIETYEYVYRPENPTDKNNRIILANTDSFRTIIQQRFERAIKERWQIDMPAAQLSVEKLGMWSVSPRFSTKLKKKEKGKWYLFLQVYDKGKPLMQFDPNTSPVNELQIRCKLINGTVDSVMADKTIGVKIYQSRAPQDQYVISALTGYPPDFVTVIDSIASWVMSSRGDEQRSITLRPPCLFQTDERVLSNSRRIDFSQKDSTISWGNTPDTRFIARRPQYTLTKKDKNAGGNFLGGALTLFTGINVSKSRALIYDADHLFEVEDSLHYHVHINFVEALTADRERVRETNSDGSKGGYSLNSGDYYVSGRRSPPEFIQAIVQGYDTLAKFSLTYAPAESERHDRYWDGTDSATILTLPDEWDQRNKITKVLLEGTVLGESFSMKTSIGSVVKEFSINSEPVFLVFGRDHLSRAVLLKPLTSPQLRLFIMLSTINYQYFYF